MKFSNLAALAPLVVSLFFGICARTPVSAHELVGAESHSQFAQSSGQGSSSDSEEANFVFSHQTRIYDENNNLIWSEDILSEPKTEESCKKERMQMVVNANSPFATVRVTSECKVKPASGLGGRP